MKSQLSLPRKFHSNFSTLVSSTTLTNQYCRRISAYRLAMLFSSNEIDEGGDQGEQRKHSLTTHVLTDQNNMAVKVIKAHALKYVCTVDYHSLDESLPLN